MLTLTKVNQIEGLFEKLRLKNMYSSMSLDVIAELEATVYVALEDYSENQNAQVDQLRDENQKLEKCNDELLEKLAKSQKQLELLRGLSHARLLSKHLSGKHTSHNTYFLRPYSELIEHSIMANESLFVPVSEKSYGKSVAVLENGDNTADDCLSSQKKGVDTTYSLSIDWRGSLN